MLLNHDTPVVAPSADADTGGALKLAQHVRIDVDASVGWNVIEIVSRRDGKLVCYQRTEPSGSGASDYAFMADTLGVHIETILANTPPDALVELLATHTGLHFVADVTTRTHTRMVAEATANSDHPAPITPAKKRPAAAADDESTEPPPPPKKKKKTTKKKE
jgi:hypothetical protein